MKSSCIGGLDIGRSGILKALCTLDFGGHWIW